MIPVYPIKTRGNLSEVNRGRCRCCRVRCEQTRAARGAARARVYPEPTLPLCPNGKRDKSDTEATFSERGIQNSQLRDFGFLTNV